MHGVAPRMCGQVVHPSLGGGAGGRSPGSIYADAAVEKCVCCGVPTPTQSMCACWPHWMVLPEDLRSELLTSYGRGELTSYHRNLLRAVEVWRNRGVWRVPLDESPK